MHTYRFYTTDVWEVGFRDGEGRWISIKTFTTEVQAATLVNFLNGGTAIDLPLLKELLAAAIEEK